MTPPKKNHKPKRWRLSQQSWWIALSVFVATTLVTTLWQRHSLMDGQKTAQVGSEPSRREVAERLLHDEIAQAGFDPLASHLKRPSIAAFLQQGPDVVELQGDWNLTGVIGDQKAGEVPERIIYRYEAQKRHLTRNSYPFIEDLDSLRFAFSSNQVEIQWPTTKTRIELRNVSIPSTR